MEFPWTYFVFTPEYQDVTRVTRVIRRASSDGVGDHSDALACDKVLGGGGVIDEDESFVTGGCGRVGVLSGAGESLAWVRVKVKIYQCVGDDASCIINTVLSAKILGVPKKVTP